MPSRPASSEPLDEVREGSPLRVRTSSASRKEVRIPRPSDVAVRMGDALHEPPLPCRRRGRREALCEEECGMSTYRPGYIAGKVKMSVYVAPEVHRALRMRAAETGVSMGEVVERYVRDDIRMAKYMRLGPDEFAQSLGFASYEQLVQASEVVVTEGDVDWYVTPLADGRWAAWDDAEIAPDRVAYFGTQDEAVEYHRTAYEAKNRR